MVPLLKKLVLQDLRDISAAEEDVIWMWKEVKLVPSYQHRIKFVPMLLLFTSDVCGCVCVCAVPAALTLCKPLGGLSISSLVLSALSPLQVDQKP